MDRGELADLVARNIRAERSRRRLRQGDVAARLGVSRPTWSAIEAGRRFVNVQELPDICLALGVPLVKLLEGVDGETLRRLGLDR